MSPSIWVDIELKLQKIWKYMRRLMEMLLAGVEAETGRSDSMFRSRIVKVETLFDLVERNSHGKSLWLSSLTGLQAYRLRQQ